MFPRPVKGYDHIDYVARRFGVEHVAIGADVAYESRFAAAERARVPRRGERATPPAASPWEHLWPEGSRASRSEPSLAWTN